MSEIFNGHRGKILKKIPKESVDKYQIFNKQLKKLMQSQEFKEDIGSRMNNLRVKFKYANSINGVDDVVKELNELLLKLGFVKSIKEAEKNNTKNKPRVSTLAGGGLDVIQLRPYKNGVAMIVFIEKRENIIKKIKKISAINLDRIINITFRPVTKEDRDGRLLGNEPLINEGDEVGVGVFDQVAGGVINARYTEKQ